MYLVHEITTIGCTVNRLQKRSCFVVEKEFVSVLSKEKREEREKKHSKLFFNNQFEQKVKALEQQHIFY